MFTFNLVTSDGRVWLSVTVQGDGITDAASKIPFSSDLTIVLV